MRTRYRIGDRVEYLCEETSLDIRYYGIIERISIIQEERDLPGTTYYHVLTRKPVHNPAGLDPLRLRITGGCIVRKVRNKEDE